MAYFSERNGISRNEIKKRSNIEFDDYSLLIDCCESFFNNIAWRFPQYTAGHKQCQGLDENKLVRYLKVEIPNLFGISDATFLYWNNKPQRANFLYGQEKDDEYDQFALLDFIEFIFKHCKDYRNLFNVDGELQCITHINTFNSAKLFRDDINDVFSKTGLLYYMNDKGQIERIVENEVLDDKVEDIIEKIPEDGIKDLVKLAIEKHRSPKKQDNKDAVEKIWGAFERLKTYYTSMDKKASSTKIISDMSNGEMTCIDLFTTEFRCLTEIGNKYRIRHQETDKIEITDIKHYDYFFNRCLSLISLAIQYLK